MGDNIRGGDENRNDIGVPNKNYSDFKQLLDHMKLEYSIKNQNFTKIKFSSKNNDAKILFLDVAARYIKTPGIIETAGGSVTHYLAFNGQELKEFEKKAEWGLWMKNTTLPYVEKKVLERTIKKQTKSSKNIAMKI